MKVEIKRLEPQPQSADGKPYRATIITRDERGALVGVRVLRAREAGELEAQIAKTYTARRTARVNGPPVGTEGNTPGSSGDLTTTEGTH